VPAKRKKQSAKRGSSNTIEVRRTAGGKGYEFHFPPGVRERAEDMEEVRAMLAAGESEIAIDELRWLLGGCHELLEAHHLLGKIAAEAGDRDLARAHFGYAFKLGTDALPKRGLDRPLPHANPANQAFHEAGAGLIQVLLELKETNQAKEVAMQLLALDPTDPLDVKKVLE
jgi:tetratricopeptide (TPR) repeat protein